MLVKAMKVAMIGICAALYAVVGRLTDLGIVAPVVGVVAFWPAAVIPAIFAVLFGPWTGGIGAGIGIFIRDMMFHGNPVLSLSAGVTANFACFYLIGYLSRKKLDWKKISLGLGLGGVIMTLGFSLPTIFFPSESSTYFTALSPMDSVILFLGTVVGSCIVIAAVSYLWPEWRNYSVASIIGLGIGSAIIGLMVWLNFQFLFLQTPTGELFHAPAHFGLLWFVWTFTTEIPFLIIVGPPVLKACFKAFPSLKPT